MMMMTMMMIMHSSCNKGLALESRKRDDEVGKYFFAW